MNALKQRVKTREGLDLIAAREFDVNELNERADVFLYICFWRPYIGAGDCNRRQSKFSTRLLTVGSSKQFAMNVADLRFC